MFLFCFMYFYSGSVAQACLYAKAAGFVQGFPWIALFAIPVACSKPFHKMGNADKKKFAQLCTNSATSNCVT